jgi:hypothetical protein
VTTDLTETARQLNVHPVAPPTPIGEIRRRAAARRRRRRILSVTVAVVVIVVAAVIGGVLVGHDSNGQVVIASTGPTTTGSPSGSSSPAASSSTTVLTSPVPPADVPPPAAVPPPAQLVVHEMQSATGNSPPPIEVIDTDTGAPVRTLGADDDPYVGDGFHVSATGLVFWTHLDQPAQTFPVAETSLAGTPARTIAYGTMNLPSPDGRWLLVQAANGTSRLSLVNPTTGASRSLPKLPRLDRQRTDSVSWLPGSASILATTVTPGEPCLVPPGATCDATTIPSVPARAWTIDVKASSPRWTELATTPAGWHGWQNLYLLGPGRVRGSVVAVATLPAAAGVAPTQSLVTVSLTGSILDQVTLPSTVTAVLAVDHSGTNFLVTDGTNLAWLSFAAPNPVVIGPAVAEATWW